MPILLYTCKYSITEVILCTKQSIRKYKEYIIFINKTKFYSYTR